MFQINARTRLVICLVMQVVSVVLLAIPLHLVPDRRGAVMRGRADLCEAIALGGSTLVQEGKLDHLKDLLDQVDLRNDDILSIGMRRDDGQAIAESGLHGENWIDGEHVPTDRQIRVPLYLSGRDHWGDVEIRFRPLIPESWFHRVVFHPWTRLLAFMAASCYLLFQLFLWRAFKNSSPNKAVPRRVRSTLETLAGGLIVLDNKENIALANQTFAEAVGRQADDLQGTPISQMDWCFAAADDTSFPWQDAMLHGSRVSSRPVRLRDVNGVVRTYMVNSSAVTHQDNVVRGVLISFDDITDLEEARAQLAQSKQIAEEANRAKSEFLARMSHEIRTPMNAVLGFADVLRRGYAKNENESKQYLDIIHSSGEHLLTLINDILDLSKIESGKMQTEKLPHSPAQIANDVTATLRVRAEEKGISLRTEFVGRVPATIQTDSVRLRQILTNLVGNAIKFTSAGGVCLQMELDPENNRLAFRVIDSGIGIPADRLEHIFDPFSQADGSVTRKFGGTGLGLAISRKLAQALGGEVVARSILGKGSVFAVTIDTGPLEGVPLLSPAEAAIHHMDQKQALAALPQGLRILVADDGESNRRLLRLVLERAGVHVVEAENGALAVEKASQTTYDFILMDVQMPVMDGLQATSQLRSQGYKAPIVALTADAMKGSEQRCLAAGCTAFLTKPVVLETLMQMLSSLLNASDGGTQPLAAVGESPAAEGPQRLSSEPQQEQPMPLPIRKATNSSPVTSSLPTDDEEFCEIVHLFVARLHEKLAEMRGFWADRNLSELAAHAHWLKGSGGTAGFADFTEPAKRLEQLTKNEQLEEIEEALQAIHDLAQRIELPQLQTTG